MFIVRTNNISSGFEIWDFVLGTFSFNVLLRVRFCLWIRQINFPHLKNLFFLRISWLQIMEILFIFEDDSIRFVRVRISWFRFKKNTDWPFCSVKADYQNRWHRKKWYKSHFVMKFHVNGTKMVDESSFTGKLAYLNHVQKNCLVIFEWKILQSAQRSWSTHSCENVWFQLNLRLKNILVWTRWILFYRIILFSFDNF